MKTKTIPPKLLKPIRESSQFETSDYLQQYLKLPFSYKASNISQDNFAEHEELAQLQEMPHMFCKPLLPHSKTFYLDLVQNLNISNRESAENFCARI
jgi:hypothetical protein